MQSSERCGGPRPTPEATLGIRQGWVADMARAVITLTVDMTDPEAVCSYVADAIEAWPESKRERLGRDIERLLDRGEGVDMLSCGPDGAIAAVVSAPFLDLLRRHGLTG